MRLSDEEIRKLAGNDVTYYRGARYFREGAVKNVTWSKSAKRYHANVNGKNEYSVNILTGKGLSCNCNCPDYVKRKQPCKHIIATLMFIKDYFERAEDKDKTPEQKKVSDILEYFNRQSMGKLYGEVFDLHVTISIPSLLKDNVGKAYVSLQAGSTRMYKIQNLRKFLGDYQAKETIVLGKEFKFIPEENRFHKKAQKVLDYLLSVYEIQESLGRVYYSNVFNRSEMILSINMLFQFLEILGDSSFTLKLNDKAYEPVNYKKGNPEIQFHITAQGDSVSLEYEDEYKVLPVTEDGRLMLYEKVLYQPHKDFLKNYLPFYTTFQNRKEPICFSGEDKERFLRLVLPKIHETMKINIPASMRERYVDEELKAVLYFDRIKNAVGLKVIFRYGTIEINPFSTEIPDNVILMRRLEEERQFLMRMEELGFYPYKDGLILRDEALQYRFLSEEMEKLIQEYEVYYADSFRTFSVRSAGGLHTYVQTSDKLDYLQLDMSFEDVPEEELREVFCSIQLKKKYHRLKDGSFLNLETQEAIQSREILEELQVNAKSRKEDGFILPKYLAVHVKQYLSANKNLILEENEDFKELVERIVDDGKRSYPIPKTIQADLRNYQKKGYYWLHMLADCNLGGVLADDMGLGKTLESIVYLAAFPKEKHLVVCPTSLVYNWQEEFETFAPNIKTLVITGNPKTRQELIEQYSEYDVLITSYPLLRRDYEWFMDVPIHTMIIDEAQFIKNPASQNAKAVKRIPAKHKFALTGTPMENSLSELWSIFDYIMPGFLMSHTKFVERYERPIVRDENQEIKERLIQKIHPFLLRRMKKEVLTELPEKIESRIVTEMTEKQTLVYRAYLENIREELSQDDEGYDFGNNQFQILSALTRLRQICCHPATFIDNYNGDSGKLELLMEQLPVLLGNGHRVLIFSQFTSMLHIIEKRLETENISYFYLDGGSDSKERLSMVEQFNNGERDVFLISLKAGGTGLNLIGADTVIHFDPWWNPAVEEQATDRVYRIGQKNTVQVIRLLTKGTIEEKIYKLQKKKRELSKEVMESREVFINRMTKEEIADLFRLDAGE